MFPTRFGFQIPDACLKLTVRLVPAKAHHHLQVGAVGLPNWVLCAGEAGLQALQDQYR
jgi:hypothetical protein